MDGEQGLRRYSPEVMAQDPNAQNAFSLLPPIYPMRVGIDDMLDDLITMIHGDNSETIPANSTPRKRLVPEFMLKMARSSIFSNFPSPSTLM
ncbi:hypothetical protein RND71_023505 [Anisodus tanguticus]|uniref:Uncharacterized protein n=1 Tax=Anisodus tanguticus TaxID=243964 RepID=A0AAE1VET7_9SOLA|nr:hypothetical protein RND71_023505 [Anisodus tanguticus]